MGLGALLVDSGRPRSARSHRGTQRRGVGGVLAASPVHYPPNTASSELLITGDYSGQN